VRQLMLVAVGGRCCTWLLYRDRPHLAGDGPRPVGQAPAWPLSSDRSVRRGSGVKRDFACTFTRHFSPVVVVLRSRSRLRLEGRTRTLSGPSPALSLTTALHLPGACVAVDQVVISGPAAPPIPVNAMYRIGIGAGMRIRRAA
jgi:hypothetical protein